MDSHWDNAFLRWHKSFEDYPDFLSDIDDIPMHETDNFERMKKFEPLEKHTVGSSPVIPREDNDEKY
jgi:hypothetical protein